MPEKKTALLLGYKCNNNCWFCYCGDKRDLPPMATTEAKRQIDLAGARGSKFIDFLGGEPTIRRDLPELIAYAKNHGFRTISITTNGRMLSKKSYARLLFDSGLTSTVFSIHGHNAELHDSLSRAKGAFKQAMKGMENVRSLPEKPYICTNTVIVKPNVRFLPEIAETCIKAGANAMEFIFPHPKGNAYENFDEMVPALAELVDAIPETIRVADQANIQHCLFRYVPLCYVYHSLRNVGELAAKSKLREQHIGPEFSDLEVEKNRARVGRVKGPQCPACQYFNSCEGVFKEYAEKRGFGELVPVA